ncbi:MAG: hypothetical protein IKQ17_12165 [Kiritimatiellae bacterium]|nr:hypothetical protein [Kiritimatiellia bacterium]
MKKLLSLSLASLAFAAVAADIQVGVAKITATSAETIIPVPYATIGSSSNVSVHDLVKAANLKDGTMLYYFNGTSYQAWMKSGSAWTTPGVSATQTIAGTSVIAGSDTVTVAVGAALWVSIPDFGNTESAQKDIYVYGSPAAASWTIVAGKSNLLSNPTNSAIADLATKLSSVSQKGDKILPIGTDFTGYWVKASGDSWSKVVGTSVQKNATLPSLGAYKGLWYVSKDGSGKVDL